MNVRECLKGQYVVLGPCDREEYTTAIAVCIEQGEDVELEYLQVDGEVLELGDGLLMDTDPDDWCRLATPQEISRISKLLLQDSDFDEEC